MPQPSYLIKKFKGGKKKMTRKLLVPLVCCLVMIFLMTTLVSAKPPIPPEPQDNVIKACYKKVNGQLRLVKDFTECHPSELPISWNQMGPLGQLVRLDQLDLKGLRGRVGLERSGSLVRRLRLYWVAI
jgi:hypothetical protein